MNFSNNIKKIVAIILGFLTIGLLTGYYAYLSLNSLNMAIYGSYIDEESINHFEKTYHKHLNIVNYTSSEQLFVKRKTSNFALTMPSEYMVNKMAQRGYLQPINYELLANKLLKLQDPNKPIDPNISPEGLRQGYFINALTNLTNSDEVIDEKGDSHVLGDYFVPYYWGSLIWIANSNRGIPNPDPDHTSWQDFWKAIISEKKIALSDDIRNTYLVATQLLLYNASHPGQLADFPTLANMDAAVNSQNYTDPLNPNNKIVIDVATNLWKWMINKNGHHISFQGDEIQNTLASNNFDYVYCYNSDLSYAYQDSPDIISKFHAAYFKDTNPIPTNSMFGGDIWMDGFTVSSNLSAREMDIAYNFLAYILEYNRSLDIVNWSGGAAAIAKTFQTQITPTDPLDLIEKQALTGPTIIHEEGDQIIINFYAGYMLYMIRFESEYSNGYNEILAIV